MPVANTRASVRGAARTSIGSIGQQRLAASAINARLERSQKIKVQAHPPPYSPQHQEEACGGQRTTLSKCSRHLTQHMQHHSGTPCRRQGFESTHRSRCTACTQSRTWSAVWQHPLVSSQILFYGPLPKQHRCNSTNGVLRPQHVSQLTDRQRSSAGGAAQ